MSLPNESRHGSKAGRRAFLFLSLATFSGCSTFFRRRDADDRGPESLPFDEQDEVEFIGELADPWGLNPSRVESIALATELDGTGSDPDPSPQRTRLLNEMKVRQVANEKELLASETTSMVLVQGYLPPAIRKGERYDVFVQVSGRSKTSSLRGGYLMPTRLKPMEVLGNGIRTGSVQSTAKGSILVDALFEADDPSSEVRGVVLGGGVAMISRPFGLVVQSDVASVEATTAIAGAINRRFSTVHNGTKTGVATPKDDTLIELLLPTEYRFHLGRFMQAVLSIVVDETPQDRLARIQQLGRELQDPFLASRAAVRLEAIGEEAVGELLRGLGHADPEIRFYAAESLAYMGHSEAAPVLGEIARREPTLRWHAMTALASMHSVEAGTELTSLLHMEEPETRYAAFRSLHARSPQDPVIRGKLMNDEFYYHVVACNASPLIHFSRSKRPEIVLFGKDQRVSDDFLFVKRGMTIKAEGNGSLSISRYAAREGDQKLSCSTRVDDVFRVLMQSGAGYEELLELVRHADNTGTLVSQVAINAVPDPNRMYESELEAGPGQVGTGATQRKGVFRGILPDLFADPASQVRDDEGDFPEFEGVSPEESPRKKSFFGRMGSWWKKDA